MGDTSNANETAEGNEKPAQGDTDVVFPPFPEPTKADFEEDISSEERDHYKSKYPDLNIIKSMRLHCTACDRHLGCSAKNENRMKVHPMLRTLICQTCLTFYNSGEFDKGDDGSELYCRWCGQGGQVYCCSSCPHVFCAKCVKRNFGVSKIKEIEDLDDWKCFKCNPKCLWDLRATCWALLRYCDQKNQITYKTLDPDLKEKYQKSCTQDYSECCKRKGRVRQESSASIKKETKTTKDPLITKITPTIQVKKFASINPDDSVKEKKAQKRPASPKINRVYGTKTMAIAPKPSNINLFSKKIKIAPAPSPIRITMEKKPSQTYTPRQVKTKPPMVYNGFNNAYNLINDNINLSLENLTQGLDMAAVASMSGGGADDDVVCTPDFPMEPLCEVTEDTGDDDVQCITPAPATPSQSRCPPLLRNVNILPDLSPGNIIQMTENDVTVNAATGGLKFRVDPQTLSSNKMYRLPDGRIFAINANPSMPGGYSATIVAVTDNVASTKITPKGATYAAKLSAVVSTPSTQSPKTNSRVSRKTPRKTPPNVTKATSTPQPSKSTKIIEKRSSRPCDLNVPVEWYRFNLMDAIDALDYSLSRLNQLKTQATTMFLRTRTVNEMRNLYKTLDRSLTTSANRFLEIKDSISNEFKNYVDRKQNNVLSDDDDDDDDVEILPDNDDPIFIDENSIDSQVSNRDVDLTVPGSSEHDSSGKSNDKNVINDDCVQLDSDKSGNFTKDIEKNKNETLRDPLMIDDKDEENEEGEKITANDSEISEIQKKYKESKESDPDFNETVSNNEVIVACNVDELSENNNSTHNKTDGMEENVGNGFIKETEDNVTDKEDVEDDKEVPEEPKMVQNDKSINSTVSSIVDSENIAKRVMSDIEVQENDLEDIEMTDAAMENNEKLMDDNEMSEKAIEELLKDDNESIDGSVNSHSVEINEENKS